MLKVGGFEGLGVRGLGSKGLGTRLLASRLKGFRMSPDLQGVVLGFLGFWAKGLGVQAQGLSFVAQDSSLKRP